MTRLKTEWISEIGKNAESRNRELKESTGLDFMELAACAAGVDRIKLVKASKTFKVAVVPVTAGEGIIRIFAESVAAAVEAAGFAASVTRNSDISGIREACSSNADIIYMADDNAFIALNIRTGMMADNNMATAAGYAEILNAAAGGLSGKRTAVLGYGIIGKLMSKRLADMNAEVFVYDKDITKKYDAEADGFIWISSENELKNFAYIADATDEGGWLAPEALDENAVIAAPGVPLSLNEDSKSALAGRYVHDMLEIGTVCMLGFVI